MINVMKIPDYETVDKTLEGCYSADNIIAEKINNNLEALFAREDLAKEEKENLALKCGDGLELFCYIELGYCNDSNEYFFDADVILADFGDGGNYSNLEDLIRGINNALSKTYNTLYGAKMNPLFYTVADHEKQTHDCQTELEQIFEESPEEGKSTAKDILFGGDTDSRGLTDEEIEKFQNLYK